MEKEILYQVTIPLHPVTKKNNQQILYSRQKGRYFISPSKEYEKYQLNCGWLLKRIREPINEPIQIICKFYRKNKVRCDLTNLLECIDDVLVHYGIIQDDNFNIICSHDGSRVYIDKENPRTEITIIRFNEEEDNV